MRGGFLYLVAVMDWFSRYVLSWELSNTMETCFCLAALHAAFRFGQPEIWNSDQGCAVHLRRLAGSAEEPRHLHQQDGRGRALDNVFLERLWRSLKYELIYPGDFASGLELFPTSASGPRLSDAQNGCFFALLETAPAVQSICLPGG
jgi:putative transposase